MKNQKIVKWDRDFNDHLETYLTQLIEEGKEIVNVVPIEYISTLLVVNKIQCALIIYNE
jgi:hypothetical protein